MNAHQISVVQSCAKGSWDGELNFPDVVTRLQAIGIERYHADYSRQEVTYYGPDGDSHVVPLAHALHSTSMEFSPAGVKAAVRQSQQNEHTYPEFIRKTMAAGCVGYFVQITGRRVIYFGRNGESHTEHFPATS